MNLSKKPVAGELAAMIDHTFLKPDGAPGAIEALCREAVQWRFGCVMVNPCEVPSAARLVAGSGVKVGTVIGFPLGQSTLGTMAFEAAEALRNGADELDFVINVRELKKTAAGVPADIGDDAIAALPLVRDYRKMLENARGGRNPITKIIIETCYLADAEKALACKVAKAAGFDFVKTSTGFGPAGATVADVALMRRTVGPDMGVKAAGGIRDLETALALIGAGANRLGCSAGVAIMEALGRKA